jgi:hypothetical protein
MSLLRGLAERALGTARPVRSQRMRPMRGPDREASAAEALAPDAIDSRMPAAIAAPAPARHPQPAPAPTAREAPMQIDANAPLVPRVVTHATLFDAAPSMHAVTPPAQGAEAAAPARRIAAPDDPAPRAQADRPLPDPEPLVARSAPRLQDAPPPRSLGAVAPRRERQSAGAATAAAASASTEVHVSIGRVELTALAPAPARRAERPRDAANARGLSDYLRGPRGAS